ncbi:hypothetical protein ACP3VS_18600 [Lysinibacillus sp. VIII_CA]|uniref:hypothetical protein n=1 Tax=Lysinibacillus sp. VIII_CA TaxID=3417452 RepID=UPI003CEB5784
MLKQIAQILEDKIKEDKRFRKDYNELIQFYLLKFMRLDTKKQEKHIEEIELILNRQFLQGYMIAMQFKEDNPDIPLITEETTIYQVLNTIPNSLREMFEQQNLDFVKVDTAEAFAMDMLTQIGTSYFDLLEQVYKEITYYGITYAILHQYPSYVKDELITNIKDVIHPYLITPQIAIIPSVTLDGASEALKYDLFNCSFKGESQDWMGRITFNPYSSEPKIAEIMLSDQIATFEKLDLLNLINLLLSENAENEKIYFNVFHISSIETLESQIKNTD